MTVNWLDISDIAPMVSPDQLAFKTAKKTKGLKAKHIQQLFADDSILSKFLLATLEGQQMLKGNSVVCVGGDNDAWQQTSEKLLKKYNVVGLDEQGWMICEPKPENEVWAAQVEVVEGSFQIIGQWGERKPDGTFRQVGKTGDYVLRSKSDPTDVWIVAKKVFDATYEIMP